MKITKRQLKRIIKEEKSRLLNEQLEHEMYAKDDELRELGDEIQELISIATHVEALTNDMGHRYGELAALGTHARMALQSVRELAKKFDVSLDDLNISNKRGWYKQ